MKQLGNLAVVCAQRPDVMMQIFDGKVNIHVGEGPGQIILSVAWDDDRAIQKIVYELNFGEYTR